METPSSLEPTSSVRSSSLVIRISKRRQVIGALVAVALASIAAYVQFTSAYEWHERYPPGLSAWWLHPIEWNIDAGLPEIVGTINAVEVIGPRVFVAGDNGLLAASEDEGRTWMQWRYSSATSEFISPAVGAIRQTAHVVPAGPGITSFFVPTLSAAVAEQSQPPTRPDDVKANRLGVDFGSVPVGRSTRNELVQFTNQSGKLLQTGVPGISGLDLKSFSIENTDCAASAGLMTPGQLCNVYISFSPVRAGKYEAYLLFANLLIPLVGAGTPPGAPQAQQSSAPSPADTSKPPASVEEATGPSRSTTTPQTPAASTPQLGTAAAPGSPPQTGTPSNVPAPDLAAFGYCVPMNCELTARNGGSVFQSTDDGLTWRPVKGFNGPSSRGDIIAELKLSAGSVRDAARGSNKRAWVVLLNGGLSRVDDGIWTPVTRAAAAMRSGHAPVRDDQSYGRFLPPWYLLILAMCGFVVLAEKEPEPDPEITEPLVHFDKRVNPKNRPPSRFSNAPSAESAIGNQATADRPLVPGEPDALELGIIATGLAFFLRNEKTRPPLVLAINGRWGSGKSSLMNLLKSRLEDYGARPVWFNAWHHQQEDQLLAALLEAVKAQAVPPLSRLAGWGFRLRLAWRRLQRSWIQLALVLGAIVLLWRIELHLRQSGLSIGSALSTLLGWTHDAPTKLAAERASAALEVATKLQSAAQVASDPALAASLRAQAESFVRAAAAPGGTNGTVATVVQWIQQSSVLALLAGVVAAFKTVSRGLRAFTTNPASLLAVDSGSTKPADLEAQTSFRQRFAAEFADVTGVLGRNRRMMILIDDLDRCRPEKVREVLEAVNFLCSSGECFIVLGMAREIVEHCVGLSFRRVVDTMPWAAFDLSADEVEHFVNMAKASEGSSPSALRVQLAAKRLAFARLFLDKLIQIEVSIPEPTPLQKRKLFETDEERKSRDAGEIRVSRWLDVMKRATVMIAPVMQGALLLLVVVGGGIQLGRILVPFVDRVTAPASVQALPVQATVASLPSPVTGLQAGTVQPAQVTPQIVAGVSQVPRGWLSGWPFYGAFLGALAVVSVALRRLPYQSVRDAKPFTNALAVWHPLVMTEGARNTPRTARRFQNRVRYLAMRQRAFVDGAPIGQVERWLRKALDAPARQPESLLKLAEGSSASPEFDRDIELVAEWLVNGVNGDCPLATVRQTSDGPRIDVNAGSVTADQLRAIATGRVQIPEPILVALAAIDELAPEWVNDSDIFSKKVARPNEAKSDDGGGHKSASLLEAIARHQMHWDNWRNLTHYRRAYLRLCSEIDRRRPTSAPS